MRHPTKTPLTTLRHQQGMEACCRKHKISKRFRLTLMTTAEHPWEDVQTAAASVAWMMTEILCLCYWLLKVPDFWPFLPLLPPSRLPPLHSNAQPQTRQEPAAQSCCWSPPQSLCRHHALGSRQLSQQVAGRQGWGTVVAVDLEKVVLEGVVEQRSVWCLRQHFQHLQYISGIVNVVVKINILHCCLQTDSF